MHFITKNLSYLIAATFLCVFINQEASAAAKKDKPCDFAEFYWDWVPGDPVYPNPPPPSKIGHCLFYYPLVPNPKYKGDYYIEDWGFITYASCKSSAATWCKAFYDYSTTKISN